MKNTKISIILIGFAIALILTEQVKAQYAIKQSVLGNGGTIVSDNTHRLVGTVGQPGIGRVNSALNIHKAGFWYQAGNIITSIESISNFLPKEFRLEQNYPNPFNPQTTIAFALPMSSFVTLKLFDIRGREVASLVDEELQPGEHKVVFDANGLSSGVYFFRIQTVGFVMTRKLMLLK
jgi:hypothetical protein